MKTSSVRFSDEDLARIERIKRRTGIDKLANILRNSLEAYEAQLATGLLTASKKGWLRKTIRAEINATLNKIERHGKKNLA